MKPDSVLALTRRQQFLHLFALCGFAIAQPILDLLARQTDFLVARQSSAGETLLLTVGLVWIPAAIAFAPVALTGLISRWLATAIHLALVFALLVLTAMSPLLRLTDFKDFPLLLISLFASLTGVALYARTTIARTFVGVLSVAPLVFATMFLVDRDVQGLIFQSSGVAKTDSAGKPSNDPPVFLLVFDALPLSSLQNSAGEIDGRDFPAFARLATQSTWYPRAYATGSYTMIALPIFLTGRYPQGRIAPATYANYPDNLFTRLAPYYELNVIESQTLLYPANTRTGDQPKRDLESLVSDISILYAHIALPKFMRREVPGITRVWGNFAGPSANATGPVPLEVKAQEQEQRALLRSMNQSEPVSQLIDFRERILEISASKRRGVLHFAHTVFPHSPWNHLPDGTRYALTSDYVEDENLWGTDPWESHDGYRRHLLQVGYADKILGELLDALERAEIFDEALVIVCVDHGESFWPGNPMREPRADAHLEDIVSVPLFVKAPGQRVGKVDNRIAEGVDILPTIMETLEADVSWPLDGCSLLRDNCPTRTDSVTHTRLPGRYFTIDIPGDTANIPDSRLRKSTLFPSGIHAAGFFGFGPYAALAGRPIREFELTTRTAGTFQVDPAIRKRVAAVSGPIPARIVGLYEPPNQSNKVHQLAVVTGGVIQSVVPAVRREEGLRVAAILPAWALTKDVSSLALFEVTGDPERPILSPIVLE